MATPWATDFHDTDLKPRRGVIALAHDEVVGVSVVVGVSEIVGCGCKGSAKRCADAGYHLQTGCGLGRDRTV